ncbi:MAG: glutamate-5-semialdehyde dehydrogenase, partial [Pseudolysinimonas sp.]
MTQTATARTLEDKLHAARTASIALATTASGAKDAGLEAIARAVEAGADRILPANELDLANGRENGLSAGLQDRLRLDPTRLSALAGAVREIIALPDPVGVVVRGSTLPNGVQLSQVRVP